MYTYLSIYTCIYIPPSLSIYILLDAPCRIVAQCSPALNAAPSAPIRTP